MLDSLLIALVQVVTDGRFHLFQGLEFTQAFDKIIIDFRQDLLLNLFLPLYLTTLHPQLQEKPTIRCSWSQGF